MNQALLDLATEIASMEDALRRLRAIQRALGSGDKPASPARKRTAAAKKARKVKKALRANPKRTPRMTTKKAKKAAAGAGAARKRKAAAR